MYYEYKENEENYYNIEHTLYSKEVFDDYLITFDIIGKNNNEEFKAYYNFRKDNLEMLKGTSPANLQENIRVFLESCDEIKELGFM